MNENRWDVDEQEPVMSGGGGGGYAPGLAVVLVAFGYLAMIAWDNGDKPDPAKVEQAVAPADPEPAEEPMRTIEEIADDVDRDGATFLTPREHVLIEIEHRRQMRERMPDDLVPELQDDGYFHWAYGGTVYRWHTLKEGQTYGGQFKFRDGVMEIVPQD